MRTVHQRGFGTIGLREITAAADVAQGSFTNHFASKEEFGVAVLDRYFGEMRTIISATLSDQRRRPIERLDDYFDAVMALFAADGWRYGCLAGNMALEAAEHSERIRHRLVEIFSEWTPPFAQAVSDAQASGEVRAELDPEEVAAALIEAWHGAMMRMKIERSAAPLERFRRVTVPALLARPGAWGGRADRAEFNQGDPA